MVRNFHVHLSFHSKHKLKHSLMLADTILENLEPIQPDIIGASSIVPSPQIETTPEKVLYLLILFIFKQLVIS